MPVVVASALLASSCGARLSDDQVAALRAAQRQGAAGAAPAGSTPPRAETAAPAAPTGGPPAASTGAGPAAVAAAAGGRAPAAPPAAAAGAGAPSACTPSAGPAQPGLSATEVRIGNVSTLSGPVPGFGKTGQNGVKAYLNYLRSQGGVCGRQLTLATADDRLDAGTNRSETERLAGEVFAFVGGTSPVDDGGAAALANTDISDVSFSFSEPRAALPNNFSPNPIDPACKCNGTVDILRSLKRANGVARAAIIYPAQAVARSRAFAYKVDLAEAAIELVALYEAPLTGATYSGFVNDMRDKGVDMVITTLELNGMADLAKAFRTAAWEPKVKYFGAQAYGRQFLSLAGPAAEGTYAGLTTAIVEDRATNPAVETFVSWYERTNPGADIDFFAILGWASADLLVTALRNAGPAPTRAGVLQQLRAQTKWDASGLLAPRNPAGKQRAPCHLIAVVKGGGWHRATPAQGFEC
ncbi:MAG TPA: ABC transporter substrate-binding protein [Acidimicrobiales bacterium]|nr:ABC transporter substrate-binding protein [Acidimicrobiales bacterium]